MSTTYSECPNTVIAIAKEIIQDHYPDLIEADVTVMYLFARNESGDALKHGGYPAAALVKLNNLRDRVAGLSDATIMIDEDRWKDWNEERRIAILDHELMHLEVRRNDSGAIEYDDCNRPKIRLRKHDFNYGGFNAIVRRHGDSSVEVQSVREVLYTWSQGIFEFAKDISEVNVQ